MAGVAGERRDGTKRREEEEEEETWRALGGTEGTEGLRCEARDDDWRQNYVSQKGWRGGQERRK